ncbi:hypothetical protein K504DRAFT_489490 [Pleomassaria siparia CBS 279.74]|uniref:Uncharacterized protein n=1 Tax=Pleomassaria siparia CBS 279.74 TaxID=1314801 RepID=A0A6G1KG93_9PLEO|nr:hypothetical protein K504DRAFT_489490 [Pleomassaria siparia CBS 279.74]
MATKVTSITSSPGLPSPPNQSPRTEATDVESVLSTDLSAVGNILGPIQEDLNEAAEVSLCPSPPMNTPALFSPTHSVRSARSQYYGRGRGLSLIGVRLAQLKLEECPSSGKDNDYSAHSVVPTVSEADEDGKHDKVDDAVSKDGIDSGEICIAYSSPALNPRIQEYLAFQPNELPVTSTAPKHGEIDRPTSAHESMKSEALSFKSAKRSVISEGGVTEKSNWAEEIVDQFERALARLEQLALDESTEDSSVDAKGHYQKRLKELLASDRRKYPLKVEKIVEEP